MPSLAQARAQARAAVVARQQARIAQLMMGVNANNDVVVTDEHGNVVKRFRTEAEAQDWMAEQNRLEYHRAYKKKRKSSRKTRVARKRRSRKSTRKTRVARKRRSRKSIRKKPVRKSHKSRSTKRKRKSHRRKRK